MRVAGAAAAIPESAPAPAMSERRVNAECAFDMPILYLMMGEEAREKLPRDVEGDFGCYSVADVRRGVLGAVGRVRLPLA
jgi:hypothetical protein